MQVEHKTEKGMITFILAPKDASGYKLEDNTLTFDVMYGIGKVYNNVLPGTKLIGLTSEITEEQAKMIVHAHIEDDGNIYGYFDYPKSDTIKDTALDSFKSLLQHLQVYEVNTLGEEPFNNDMYYPASMSIMHKIREEWQEAQSRTGKWVVLFKPND